jgi:hypothetical protein
MYDLLEEVGVRMPAEADEQAQARRLLDRLAGAEAVGRFRELSAWLESFRERLAGPDGGTALDHALLSLAPSLARQEAGDYTHHLSFRLHLRNRLLRHCHEEGWRCDKGDLAAALGRLDRDWMAMLLGRAASQLEEFWERVRAPLSEEPVPAGAS